MKITSLFVKILDFAYSTILNNSKQIENSNIIIAMIMKHGQLNVSRPFPLPLNLSHLEQQLVLELAFKTLFAFAKPKGLVPSPQNPTQMTGRIFVVIFFFWAVLTIITPTLVHLSETSKSQHLNGKKFKGTKKSFICFSFLVLLCIC